MIKNLDRRPVWYYYFYINDIVTVNVYFPGYGGRAIKH